MTMILALMTALYSICAFLLTCYAIGTLILLLLYLFHRRARPDAGPVSTAELPGVAVQLPVYNELYVAERLLEACAALDYPREKLWIQVLDDSTDETAAIIARKVAALQARGVQIAQVRRDERRGYKAGALAHGLALLPAGVAFTAVFDADFVPPADFLVRTMPYLLRDSRLGMVQARWGHLNREDNILTRWQAIAVDGHFVVEQTARNRAGFLTNFTGTGGVWRVQAIREAGGWKDTTLTEDLDLSYRAQLAGWQFLYLPDVVVPGELPAQIAAFKQQQARWARGNTQCMLQLVPAVWTSARISPLQKVMATMHLCQYLANPLILAMLLLTPVLLLTGSLTQLPVGPLGIAWLAPPLVFVLSQRALYADWKRRVLELPALVAFGTGIAWSNAGAVLSGLFGGRGEFRRTPKTAQQRSGNRYALRGNSGVIIEVLLCGYAAWGALVALRLSPTVVPYLLMYAFAFGMVAAWGLREGWATRHAVEA